MKIMTISDSPTIFSGLARVHRNVIEGMVEAGHEVMPLGWFAYDSETLGRIKAGKKVEPLSWTAAGRTMNLLCVPKKNGMNAMYAVYDAWEFFRPDVIITIGDHWDFWYMRAIKSKTDFASKWLAYLTIEHDEIGPKWTPLFQYMDSILVPSEFGRAVIRDQVGIEAEVVPYGTDGFRRLGEDERAALRRERCCEDKVRFITVAQNTARKNLPALLQAIGLLSHRDPNRDMSFYLHTNVDASDPQEAYTYDLEAVARKLGVRDRVSFPGDATSVFDAPGDEALAREYNASDFFVLPSTCEGYALTCCEAMACGLPVIANATSTMPEHLGSTGRHGPAPRGYLVAGRDEIWPPARVVRPVRPEALSQAIWDMFALCRNDNAGTEMEKMRAACQEYAKERTWKAMKTRIMEAVTDAMGPSVIPVEEL